MTDRERSRRAAILAVAPLHDDALGMKWWNALDDRERKRWMQIAGNTGRAKDAWEAFKRASPDDNSLPAVSRASHLS
jgi:hypothetical protein